jgi:adenosine 3'-phospho 5'-phosphosulfate transporter B2
MKTGGGLWFLARMLYFLYVVKNSICSWQILSYSSFDPYGWSFDMQALKFVSFPVQTLAKCAKMIPVMVRWTPFVCCVCKRQSSLYINTATPCSGVFTHQEFFVWQLWGTVILRKKYGFHDYLVALVVTAGCTIFFLTGVWTCTSSSLLFLMHSSLIMF